MNLVNDFCGNPRSRREVVEKSLEAFADWVSRSHQRTTPAGNVQVLDASEAGDGPKHSWNSECFWLSLCGLVHRCSDGREIVGLGARHGPKNLSDHVGSGALSWNVVCPFHCKMSKFHLGKICRKPWFLPLNMVVSCNFSLKATR